MTICGILASTESGATASAVGVVPKPATKPLVVDDELLSKSLGVVGDRRVIPEDEFDLLASHGRAVLLTIEPYRRLDLLSRRGERPCHRQNESDPDSVLRDARVWRECRDGGRCQCGDDLSA